MFVIFALVMILLLGVLHFGVYKTFLHFGLIRNLKLLNWFRVVMILLALSFPVASVLSNSFDSAPVKVLYLLAAVWIGTAYFLLCASVLYWISFGASKVLMMEFSSKKVGSILFGLAVLVSVYGLWHSSAIRIQRVDVTIPNLPSVWKGRTAVLVADTHFGHVRGENFSTKVVRVINELDPDIVFVAGDYYDGVKVNEEAMSRPWQNIRAPLGAFFANGNHETYSNTAQFVRAVESAGITVLNNRKVQIDGVQIIGLDYAQSSDRDSFENSLKSIGVDSGAPSILIKHVPDNIDITQKYNISLQIAGHSHNGQVFPFNLLTAKIFKGFNHGLKSAGNSQVYTTSGVGSWGPPQRVGTDSEIIQIRFR